MITEKEWVGDPIKNRIGAGSKIWLDDLNGWIYYKDRDSPTDRPVWVISDNQRRCIVSGGVFVKWSILDEGWVFWHPMEITDEQSPPDFPTNFRAR